MMDHSSSASNKTEQDPLLDGPTASENDKHVVVPTSAGISQKEMTVHALLESPDFANVERGMVFMRRVFALLVLQYMTILLIASPFPFVETFREAIHPYHNILEAIAVTGIVVSLCLAIARGMIYPFAHVSLVTLTLFVSLELGLSFASASWGKCGIVAVGQATTSFAVILALLQFETRSMEWLTYPSAGAVCFVVSCLWMAVLVETGSSLAVSIGIGLGGWVFAIMNLYCCHHITTQVAPEEYILATLFILVPEALVFLAANKRHPKENDHSAV